MSKSHVVYRFQGFWACRIHIRSRFCDTGPQSRDNDGVLVAVRPKIANSPFLQNLPLGAHYQFWQENRPSSCAPSRFPPKWSEGKTDFAGIAHGVRVVGLRKKKKKKKRKICRRASTPCLLCLAPACLAILQSVFWLCIISFPHVPTDVFHVFYTRILGETRTLFEIPLTWWLSEINIGITSSHNMSLNNVTGTFQHSGRGKLFAGWLAGWLASKP